MLKLRGERFKGYETLDFETPIKGITLLSGESGTGKTSILDALSFSLYDSKSKIYPWSSKGTRKPQPTWVEITLDDITIRRQKRSNLLQVTIKNETFEDQIAQNIINQKFGNSTLWNVASYMRQGSLCGFFGMMSSDKLKFFHELISFDVQRHRALLNLCNENISKLQGEEKLQNRKLEELRIIRKSKSSMSEEDVIGGLWTKRELKVMNKVIGENCSEFEELDIKYNDKLTNAKFMYTENTNETLEKLHKLRSVFDRIQDLYNTEEETSIRFEKLPKITSNEIGRLDDDIQKLHAEIQLTKQQQGKRILKEQMEDLQKQRNELEIYEIKYSSEKLQHWKEIYEKYDSTKLISGLKKIEEMLEYRKLKSKYKEKEDLEKNLTSVKLELSKIKCIQSPKQLNERLLEIETQIKMVSVRCCKLICPECTSEVYLTKDSKLMSVPENDHESSKELKENKQKVQLAISNHEKQTRLNETSDRLSEELKMLTNILNPGLCPHPGMSKISNSKLEQHKITISGQLELHKEIPNLLTCKKIIEMLKLSAENQKCLSLDKQIQKLETQIESLSCDVKMKAVEQLEIQLCEKRIKFKELVRVQEEKTSLGKTLDGIKSQKDKLLNGSTFDQLPEEITKLETHLDNNKQEFDKTMEQLKSGISKIREQYFIKELYNLDVGISEMENVFLGVTSELGKLKKITKSVIAAEHVCINDTLQCINNSVNDIISEFFDEYISINILSVKELKSTGQIKPEIAMKINFMGEDLNSVLELSGGERSRVSIAMAIAFAKVSPSKLFLLDESMSTFGIAMKMKIVQMIKKHIPNKIVIIVSYCTNEGLYDSVLKLKN